MSRSLLIALTGLLCSLTVGCDTAGTEKSDPVEIRPTAEAQLSTSSVRFRADSAGSIHGRWSDSGEQVIWDAGVWVAGRQSGKAAATLRVMDASNYRSTVGERSLGIYRLRRDSIGYVSVADWPVEYGAPTQSDGTPLVSGEEMLWSAFRPYTGDLTGFSPETLLESPIPDVTITQSIVAFREAEVADFTRIEYNITNDGSAAVSDLYLGFYADVDIQTSGCIFLGRNSVAFNSTEAFSYTYPSEARGDTALTCDIPVVGYTIRFDDASEPATLYHPPLGKNADIFEFSEATLRTPDDVIDRLRAVSSTGEPLTNPEDGQPTPYAFTGDPVEETGWLGIESDVRSLLSSGPFELEAGGSLRFFVGLVTARRGSLAESIEAAKEQLRMAEQLGHLPSARF